MNNIQSLLDRGFGLVTINSLLSLTFHDNILLLKVADLPGVDFQPDKIEIESRSVSGIVEEIRERFTDLLSWYHFQILLDISTL